MKVCKSIVIENELGLHARPAAKIAKVAKQYQAKVYLRKGGREAEADSILDVLSLACSKGSKVDVWAEGVDAAEAVEAITTLLREGIE